MKIGKKVIRLSAIFLAAFVLVSCIGIDSAYAETPYKTYTVNGYDNLQETQSAYLPYKTLVSFGNNSFSAPSDVYVTADGEIYVADTGNHRIIVGNINSDEIKVIGENVLKSPRGVFVTEENDHVYVADRDAKSVFEFDTDGTLLNTYGKPDSPLYGDDLEFMPIKIVVNDAGVMYIVCESNTNGVVEIAPTDGGTFLGYFGTNFASVNLRTIVLRAILTDAQRAKMVSNIPATPDNLAIDSKGLIYTVTRADEEASLKRLNIAGTNLLASGTWYTNYPAAVAAGNHDNVYVVDQNGYILEYNNEGDLLFVFGGSDDDTQRIGLSKNATGIAVDTSDRIYILDADKNQIQIYEPTEFTNLLHEALYLYSNGLYTESKEPLSRVLEMNSTFAYANQAMGRAYFQEENYAQALRYATLSNDRGGYSDAYWEVRNVWLKKNLVSALLVILAVFIIWKVLKSVDRKKGIFAKPRAGWAKVKENKFVSNLCYAKYFMSHPIDGSYGIAREGRANWSVSTLLLVIFMIEFVVDKYLCGFLQKTVQEGRYDIGSDIGQIIVVIVALTACNYLICAINEGEGTVKKIYTYFCYSLMPYIFLTPVSFVLSHVLTTNEQFLINLCDIVMLLWLVVLAILAIKEVNNYTSGETFKIICLTAFCILIMALLIFIIYVLWSQVIQFVQAIYGEVVYRLGN